MQIDFDFHIKPFSAHGLLRDFSKEYFSGIHESREYDVVSFRHITDFHSVLVADNDCLFVIWIVRLSEELEPVSYNFTLPNDINSIEEEAFLNDIGLTAVYIPDGCASIGARAFAGCSNLSYIRIPADVTTIGENAFEGCDSLTIVGDEESAAADYAEENDISFIAE